MANKRRILFDGDTIELNGRSFTVEFPYDDIPRTPWEDSDGHGVVSEWKHHAFGMGSKPPKSPGERILIWDRGSYRTYDVAETIKIAKRDGWGLGPDDESKLAQSLGRAPTRKEIIAQAVENDFEYLRRWCNDQWHYCGVVVKYLDDDGDELDSESLWGIEDDAYDYLNDVAHELAGEINHRLDTKMAKEISDSRPDLAPTY